MDKRKLVEEILKSRARDFSSGRGSFRVAIAGSAADTITTIFNLAVPPSPKSQPDLEASNVVYLCIYLNLLAASLPLERCLRARL